MQFYGMNEPTCPKCEGEMWNNSTSKRNPKAPDFKCKDKECNGVIWLDAKKKNGNGTPLPGEPCPRLKEDARHYLMRSANLLKLAHSAAKAIIGDEYAGEDARTLFIDAQRAGYVGAMPDKPIKDRTATVADANSNQPEIAGELNEEAGFEL